jgi:hypothetical protein
MIPISVDSSTPVTVNRSIAVINTARQSNISDSVSSITTSTSRNTESQEFCPLNFTSVFSSIIGFIRNCLSNLVTLFTNTASRSQIVTKPITDGLPRGDELLYVNMQNKLGVTNRRELFPEYYFHACYAFRSPPSPFAVSLTQTQVIEALNIFRQIQNPRMKIDAFNWILSANNSTDNIAKQFYDELSEDLQREFRERIYVANGRNDENHGIGFGEHIIATNIRGALSRQAALDMLINIVAREEPGLITWANQQRNQRNQI